MFKTWLELSQSAIKHNIAQFRKIIKPKVKLMAVVKSNAYGHGLVNFSRLAEKFGVDWFGVDSLIEGLKLRKQGIKKPALVLGYTLNNHLEQAARNNIGLSATSLESLKIFGQSGQALKIHLKIDTGMHRQGLMPADWPGLITLIKKFPCLQIEGVWTHFASAKDRAYPFYTLQQLKKFHQAVNYLNKRGVKIPFRHTAASGGALLYPESHLEMVRIGIGLYGYWPSKEAELQYPLESGLKINLHPVLTWKTIIAQIKKIPAGSFIGYDLIEKVERPSRIAVLPIGYWHGMDRRLSNQGEVLIKGRRAKILGRVSMDITVVDVTDIPHVRSGDEVVIIGRQDRDQITADQIARQISTISYEFLTRINPLIFKKENNF